VPQRGNSRAGEAVEPALCASQLYGLCPKRRLYLLLRINAGDFAAKERKETQRQEWETFVPFAPLCGHYFVRIAAILAALSLPGRDATGLIRIIFPNFAHRLPAFGRMMLYRLKGAVATPPSRSGLRPSRGCCWIIFVDAYKI